MRGRCAGAGQEPAGAHAHDVHDVQAPLDQVEVRSHRRMLTRIVVGGGLVLAGWLGLSVLGAQSASAEPASPVDGQTSVAASGFAVSGSTSTGTSARSEGIGGTVGAVVGVVDGLIGAGANTSSVAVSAPQSLPVNTSQTVTRDSGGAALLIAPNVQANLATMAAPQAKSVASIQAAAPQPSRATILPAVPAVPAVALSDPRAGSASTVPSRPTAPMSSPAILGSRSMSATSVAKQEVSAHEPPVAATHEPAKATAPDQRPTAAVGGSQEHGLLGLGLLTDPTGPVGRLTAPLVDPLASALTPVTAPIASAIAPVVAAVRPSVDTLTAPVGSVVTTLTAPIEPIARDLEGAAAPVVTAVAQVAAPVATMAGGAIAPVVDDVTASTGRVLTAVSAPLVQTLDPVTSLVSSAVVRPADQVVTAVTSPVLSTASVGLESMLGAGPTATSAAGPIGASPVVTAPAGVSGIVTGGPLVTADPMQVVGNLPDVSAPVTVGALLEAPPPGALAGAAAPWSSGVPLLGGASPSLPQWTTQLTAAPTIGAETAAGAPAVSATISARVARSAAQSAGMSATTHWMPAGPWSPSSPLAPATAVPGVSGGFSSSSGGASAGASAPVASLADRWNIDLASLGVRGRDGTSIPRSDATEPPTSPA